MSLMMYDYNDDGTILGTQHYDLPEYSTSLLYGGDMGDILRTVVGGVKDFVAPILKDSDLRKEAQEAIGRILREGIKRGSKTVTKKINEKKKPDPTIEDGGDESNPRERIRKLA